jgi:hypothetical protein
MKTSADWLKWYDYLSEICPETSFEVIRDFTADVGHDVRLYSLRGWCEGRDLPWLVCGCDVKESLSRVVNTKACKLKERARQILLQEIRSQNYSRWCAMSPADVIYDVWKMYKADKYVGTHGLEGSLSAWQFFDLLFTPKSTENRPEGSCFIAHDRKLFWEAMDELERRKLLEADGLAVMEYQERFRFPRDLLGQLEHWVVEQDPGCGFGGIGTIHEICADVARRTRWRKGESVFGKNIPWMTEGAKERCRTVWIPALDTRLADETYQDKAHVLDEIPVEVWVGWLKFIRRDLIEHDLF